MKQQLRSIFNQNFTVENYQKLINRLNAEYNHVIPFRTSETPIFLTKKLYKDLLLACEEISETFVNTKAFKEKSKSAILPHQIVPNEDEHTIFLQLDFGVCTDEKGQLVPQLIEAQGFPTLYFFQELVTRSYKDIYQIPDDYTSLFGGLDTAAYFDLLERVIVGDSNPENVIVMEIDPHNQATAVDFYATSRHLGTPVKCISEVKRSGRDLYYIDGKGKKIGIEKIYNRVIFDELEQRTEYIKDFSMKEEVDVEWIGHPHWFARISKHTLPLIKSQFNPPCYYLNELSSIPHDLENYVLKPLFSFSGSGVVIDVKPSDIQNIKDPENYLLQKKVSYTPVISTPSGSAKCEIRMLMIWEKGSPKPVVVNNLVRMSKGKMVGVKYNKDKDWVGGSVALYPQEFLRDND